MNRYFSAGVSENIRLNNGYSLLTLSPLVDTVSPEPGQFYMIGTGGSGYDPLLKRPFSLFRNTRYGIQFLYRIKGRGTRLISSLAKGSVIDALGPLGNCYPMPERENIPVVVAGGIGIASVFSLAERLSEKAYVFYGARTRDELLFIDELKGLAKELFVSTDDGSAGMRGTIIDLLDDFLTHNSQLIARCSIYACGPAPFFRSLYTSVKDRGIRTYVSLEENMACGIGACLGCVTNTVSGHRSVCKDGPVFLMDDIVW